MRTENAISMQRLGLTITVMGHKYQRFNVSLFFKLTSSALRDGKA
jgi:hypothetical protein